MGRYAFSISIRYSIFWRQISRYSISIFTETALNNTRTHRGSGIRFPCAQWRRFRGTAGDGPLQSLRCRGQRCLYPPNISKLPLYFQPFVFGCHRLARQLPCTALNNDTERHHMLSPFIFWLQLS
jgi:hypothetical protein